MQLLASSGVLSFPAKANNNNNKYNIDLAGFYASIFYVQRIMGILTALIPAATKLIDKIFKNEEDKRAAKAEMLEMLHKAEAEAYKAKGEIVKAEAKGESWLQRNWRPIAMMIFLTVIVNNYILAPYLAAFGITIPTPEIADQMWTLLTVGIGGYIVGRSGEKIVRAKGLRKDKFYNELRNEYGKLTQEQVDAFERALDKANE